MSEELQSLVMNRVLKEISEEWRERTTRYTKKLENAYDRIVKENKQLKKQYYRVVDRINKNMQEYNLESRATNILIIQLQTTIDNLRSNLYDKLEKKEELST